MYDKHVKKQLIFLVFYGMIKHGKILKGDEI